MIAADALEPLILADGTRIDPTTGKAVKKQRTEFTEVPAPSVAQDIVVRARRSVTELPMPPAQLTSVAVVAFYTLYGLSDTDIAIACGNKITTVQIKNMRQLDAYKDFMVEARKSLLATEAATVRELIASHGLKAANKIIDAIDGDDNVLAFKASQDILDRGGHRPVDVVEHHHKMDNALNIVVTKRDESLLIDADAIEVNYEGL